MATGQDEAGGSKVGSSQSFDRQTSLGFAKIDVMETVLFDPPPQQLQSVGDLIGRAVRLYRKNIKLFFHVLIWPTVFLTAAKVAFHWGVTNFSLRFDQKDWTLMGISAFVALIGILGLISVGFYLTLKQLAFIRLVDGYDSTYNNANAYVMRRKWKIVGLILLSYLFIIGTSILWLVAMSVCMAFFKANTASTYPLFAGIVFSLIGFLVTITITSIALYLAFGVGACEDLPIVGLFKRSLSLLFQDFWRAGYFCTLLFIALMAVQYPLSLPIVLVSIFEFMRQGMTTDFVTDPGKMPFYFTLVNQAWESIISMVTWPISFMATGLFYYDLRMRKEGIDLLRQLDSISKPAAAIAEEKP
ncbi:MAG: hypothetical protein IT342_08435 [Candidatus Melainabacteria bacterium]|nr:hypothetical protein [Candidatus Melainabacteria bacterium]